MQAFLFDIIRHIPLYTIQVNVIFIICLIQLLKCIRSSIINSFACHMLTQPNITFFICCGWWKDLKCEVIIKTGGVKSMKMHKNNIAHNLTTLRYLNKFSQEDVAERIGVSRQAVAKWESGVSQTKGYWEITCVYLLANRRISLLSKLRDTT